VEVSLRLERGQPPLGIGGGFRPDSGWVTFGGGAHRLRAAIDNAYRSSGRMCGDSEKRLDRDIELAAKTTAARRRANSDLIVGHSKHARSLRPVHVGRLRA